MWHFLITDLVPPADDSGEHLRPRLPGLEARLALGRRHPAAPSWRHEWRALAGHPAAAEHDCPLGPDLALAAGVVAQAPAWAVVSPVRLAAGLDHVQMERAGGLPRAELVQAFNRDFGSADGLLVLHGETLLWGLPRALDIHSHDPQGLRGHDVGPRLPSGADAPFVRRWMTEAQMWLHAADSPGGINGLWPWGFGAATSARRYPAAPSVEGAGPRATLWRVADHADGVDTFAAADAAWCRELDTALRTVGRAAVWLAGQRHELAVFDRWRVWRRWHTPRPWWQ